jgi:LemA protein
VINLLVVVVALLAVLAIAYLFSYNRLVVDRQKVHDSWATIDTELERRHALIPALIDSVSGAAAHERQLLDDLVAKERSAAGVARTADARSDPEHQLAAAARAVVALRERYPALNTQENFLALQKELSITEDRIGAARRFYNIRVAELNRRTEAFPSNIVAARHGFARAAYFDPD